MKKIRVGIFTHDFYPFTGGQGRHLYELYLQHASNGKTEWIIFSPAKNKLHNHVQLFPETLSSRLKNIEFSYRLHRKIDQLIDEYKLDIVHFHGGPGGLCMVKQFSIPKIFTSHHTYWQQSKFIENQQWKKLFYYFERKGYETSDKVICVSEDTRSVLESQYGIESETLVYIPNGIDTKRVKPKKESHSTDLLYVGRIDKRKGTDFLIRSMKLVNEVNPNIRLHVVGEGKDKRKMEALAKKLKINAVFYGFTGDKNLDSLYDQVSIQIVPSAFEGFGLTVLEAMAKKIPVIATNVDGIKSIIKSGTNGLLIQYPDEKELAHTIIELLHDKRKQFTLVSHAYRQIGAFDWKHIHQNVEEVYASFR